MSYTSGPDMVTRHCAQGQIGDMCRELELDFDHVWSAFQNCYGDNTEYNQDTVKIFIFTLGIYKRVKS